ncbi:MAG: SBBP repeat-containing protein, partial [Ignavibacteria bacterium]|nr:SBBP repeat-containing protein [Ignavibacteria bacterium]
MKTLLVTILFSLSSIYSYSQSSEQWVARFNGSGNMTDAVNKTKVDRFGNIYISGYTNSTGGNIDFCVLKYNSAGTLLWSRTYDGPNHLTDDAYAMTIDNDANVYLTGVSHNSPGTDLGANMITVKYSPSGEMLWLARFGNMFPSSIAVDAGGNVFVSANGFALHGFTQFVLVKYNSSGVQQWDSYPVSVEVTQVKEITSDLSGNIIVTGEEGFGNSSFATWKFDTSGNILWENRYHYPSGGTYRGVFVKTDASGNIYTTGENTTSGLNNCDFVTIKYNSAGERQWVAVYQGTSSWSKTIRGMTIDAEKNVYITGNSNSDYATIKYNENGEQQWCSIYNGEANGRDEVYGIGVDKESNVYITGWSSGLESMNCVTIKYNTYGVQQWKQAYHGSVPGTNCTNSIAVDSTGNVYVAGFSEGEGTQADIILIKYGQTTEVNPVSTQLPTKYSLAQNYPNPFNPNSTIEFTLPENTFVTLKIFDVTGREMNTLINENMKPGSYRYNYNGL